MYYVKGGLLHELTPDPKSGLARSDIVISEITGIVQFCVGKTIISVVDKNNQLWVINKEDYSSRQIQDFDDVTYSYALDDGDVLAAKANGSIYTIDVIKSKWIDFTQSDWEIAKICGEHLLDTCGKVYNWQTWKLIETRLPAINIENYSNYLCITLEDGSTCWPYPMPPVRKNVLTDGMSQSEKWDDSVLYCCALPGLARAKLHHDGTLVISGWNKEDLVIQNVDCISGQPIHPQSQLKSARNI